MVIYDMFKKKINFYNIKISVYKLSPYFFINVKKKITVKYSQTILYSGFNLQ